MKNNKGFSLVELIIVIAIMAILVGVLAPNLIKQLEKAKVSSDLELCQSVVTAMTTAYTDAATIIGATTSTTETNLNNGCELASIVSNADTLATLFYQNLGAADAAAVKSSLKSNGATAISIEMTAEQQIHVWLPGTDSTGSKKGNNTISVN